MTKEAGLNALQKLKADLSTLNEHNQSSWIHQCQHITKELFGEKSGVYAGFWHFSFYDSGGLNIRGKIKIAEANIDGAIAMAQTLPDDIPPTILEPLTPKRVWLNKILRRLNQCAPK